jgi:hypothetical protein
MANANYTPAPDVAAAEAAQAQGQADAQRRQDYYSARPGEGVPTVSSGASPELLALLGDQAVTGVHSVPGTVRDG